MASLAPATLRNTIAVSKVTIITGQMESTRRAHVTSGAAYAAVKKLSKLLITENGGFKLLYAKLAAFQGLVNKFRSRQLKK